MPSMELAINKALQLHQTGKLQEAACLYESILKRNPGNVDALHLLGVAHLQTKNYPSSEKLIRKALILSPKNPEVYNNLGTVLQGQGKLDEAIENYRKAVSLKPDFALSYTNLGKALKEQNKLDEAAENHRKAVLIEPDFAMAYNNLGTVLQEQNKLDEAIEKYWRAISLQPDFAGAYSNLGKVLQEQGKLDDAMKKYRKAVSLEPDFAMAYYNLGKLLQEQNKLDEAAENYRKAILIEPDFAMAYNNLGTVLQEQNKVEAAIENYRKSILLKFDNAQAHFNLSATLLLKGYFQDGWEEYEWRLRLPKAKVLRFDKPLWQGECHKDTAVLIHTEQGYGDIIQFVRYLPMVKEKVGRVIFACPESLKSLFNSLAGVDELVDISNNLSIETFDYYVALMSLPGIFRTRIETIPASVPYIYADGRPLKKSQKLDNYSEKYKIGIVWQGNPMHKKDRDRSCRFEDFVPLLSIPHVQFFSLQREEDIIPWRYKEKVVDLGPILHTFADTAVIIAQLDLVISVDTAIAHLAGAMGKLVWALIPFAPDWRWMMNREDSPWYPTMSLFRQSEMGSWGDVLRTIQEELMTYLECASPCGGCQQLCIF